MVGKAVGSFPASEHVPAPMLLIDYVRSFLHEFRVASLLVPAILNGQTGNQDSITWRYLWVSLRTASSIFHWFINLFVNDISWSSKVTQARSAVPSLEEQSHRSRHHHGWLWLRAVWNMADNTNHGHVEICCMLKGWQDNVWGAIMAPVVSVLAPEEQLCVITASLWTMSHWLGRSQSLGEFFESMVLVGSVLDWTDPYPAAGLLLWGKVDGFKSCSESWLDVCYNKGWGLGFGFEFGFGVGLGLEVRVGLG